MKKYHGTHRKPTVDMTSIHAINKRDQIKKEVLDVIRGFSNPVSVREINEVLVKQCSPTLRIILEELKESGYVIESSKPMRSNFRVGGSHWRKIKVFRINHEKLFLENPENPENRG